MRVVVVGGGPIGMFNALALKAKGHEVVLVDRDPGPREGDWNRRGVMQFNLPHGFRSGARVSMQTRVPGLMERIVQAGAVVASPEGLPEEVAGVQCRRSTFERAIWEYAADTGLDRITGHADELLTEGDRVTGLTVDGAAIAADLVIVATGRAGRFAGEVRAPGESLPCGFSYASRMYRALPGVQVPETGFPFVSEYDGYIGITFPQDDQTISALIIRQTDDEQLAAIREVEVYEQAVRLIPQLAPWTDPARFEPITPVMAGSGLFNAYRGQRDVNGEVALSGVVFVGDSVCTTNPAAGRGITLGMWQAEALLDLLDTHEDLRVVAELFDDWCTENVRPWFEDHVRWDATLLDRMHGVDLDPDGPLPAMLICQAAEFDPSIMATAGPFLGMYVGPRVVQTIADKARAALRTGWRPTFAVGPSRDELVDALFVPVAG